MKLSGRSVLLVSNGDAVSSNIALALAQNGSRLVLMGDENRLREVAGKIANSVKDGGRVEVIQLDMNEERERVFDEAVDKAWKCHGKLDAFVNCYTYEGKLSEPQHLPEDEFGRIVRMNYMSAWFLLKAVSKRMQHFGGSIVLMISIIGMERGLYPGAAAYGSSLAAVNHLVRAFALEMGKYNIRVNGVARGLQLNDGFPSSVGKQKAEKSTKDVVPLQRWLDAEKDLASTVLYLVGDGSKYMTGNTIYVDGGMSLVRPRMRSFI